MRSRKAYFASLCLISAIVIFALIVMQSASLGPALASIDLPLYQLLLAGGFYLLSHFMRAVRLAIISAAVLGLSFRTAALLHFFIAPWSFIMPFKLDELLRLVSLAKLSDNMVGSGIVIVIDRILDALIFIVVLGVLLSLSEMVLVNRFMPFVLVLGGVVVVFCLVFFLLPVILVQFQRHLISNFNTLSSIRATAFLHKLRESLIFGRSCFHNILPFGLTATAVIWIFEVGSLIMATRQILPADIVPGLLSGLRQSIFQQNLAGADTGIPPMMFLILLMLLWPFVSYFLLPRVPFEPRRKSTVAFGREGI